MLPSSTHRRTYLKALLTGFIVAAILFLVCIGYLLGNEGLNRQDLTYIYLEPICITVAVLATIAFAAIWLLTCVDAFMQRQWIWGIAILVFSWIPMLVYQIIEIRKHPSDTLDEPAPPTEPDTQTRKRSDRRRDDAVPRGPRDI